MLRRIFPFLAWFPIRLGDLRADALAGLTVAVVLIPQSMAYAELAGLPPWMGLYAAFLPVILGGLWGSSNHLQTGPGATIALLTASVLGPLAVSGSTEYAQLAMQLAFIIGVLWLAISLLRLTFVMNFISRPVIEGFLHAGGIIIFTSQLGRILGLERGQESHYFTEVTSLLSQLDQINGTSLLLGGLSLVVLWVTRRWFPRVPGALVVVVGSTWVVYQLGLSDPLRVERPLAIVGEITPGLPRPIWAVPNGANLIKLLPGAVIIALVGFIEMSSVARGLAARSRQKINLNQETIGQALASFGSAFSGGFPVNGSFSRSALNFSTGGRSGLSAVFTGVFVLIFLVACTRWLHFLPQTVLAAIIISAVLRLLDFRQLGHYMAVNKPDGVAALGCFFATLVCAPHLERGILFGATISILMHLYQMMRPHVALLGRHPDGSMRDAALHELETDPHLPAIRLDGRLFFANVSYFEERVRGTCEHFPEARYLALVFNGINEIDASGTEMLKELVRHLKADGVELLLVGVKAQVMDVMRRSGLLHAVGEENIFSSFDRAQQATYARLPSDLTYTI